MEAHAFEELVGRHQGIVCGVAYAILRDRARSEEVAQEAFLLAWQKRIDAPAWICAVARNLARNAARRRREVTMVEEPVEITHDARDVLIAREDSTRAHDALARLPAPLREAVVVYYHGNESMAAVAAALEISHDAAKQRVHRGRAQLRAALAPVEAHLRRARPGTAFTGTCVAAWLARGDRAAAATSTSTAATSTSAAAAAAATGGGIGALLVTSKLGWAAVLAAVGGFATAATIDTRPAAVTSRAFAPLERLHFSDGTPAPALPATATLGEARPDAPLSLRWRGGNLTALTSFIEGTINVPLRVADGFDPRVAFEVDEVPILQVIDDVLVQAHAKRTEIAAVRIVQQGGRIDAASLGGDLVTVHYHDRPMTEVIRDLEPALHLPIFRDARLGQAPGPTAIDGELYFTQFDEPEGELELVPHVTIDLVNVTAGEALGQILEQTGLGFTRTTGYFIAPR